MFEIYHVCWFLMAQVPSAASGNGEAAGGGAPQDPGLFGGLGFFLPAMIAIMLIWIFMMPRPQQNGAAKTSELLAKMKKNDRVVTAGGVLGVVVSFGKDDEFVTLRIDDSSNARIQVLSTSIVRILAEKETKTS